MFSEIRFYSSWTAFTFWCFFMLRSLFIVGFVFPNPLRSSYLRDTLVETACRLCSCSSMGIIYCCPIQLGGEISNYTDFLLLYSFPLPLPSSLPFSLPVLGGCQILTLEAPLITGKASCMYNGYIYSKDDVRSPFVKPPWFICRRRQRLWWSLHETAVKCTLWELQASCASGFLKKWRKDTG
jgi:hypothetical protein